MGSDDDIAEQNLGEQTSVWALKLPPGTWANQQLTGMFRSLISDSPGPYLVRRAW